MSIDASLEPVFNQLPIEARNILTFQSRSVQSETLTALRDLMEIWEAAGANFDPIQWELLLNSLTEVIVDMRAELRDEKNLVAMMLGQP